jgi:hypothetical protein
MASPDHEEYVLFCGDCSPADSCVVLKRSDGSLLASAPLPMLLGDVYTQNARLNDGSVLFWRVRYGTITCWHCYLDPVSTDDHVSSPVSPILAQNAPNPFNPSTQINYSLPTQGSVRIAIYDVRGREVRVLVDDVKPAGNYNCEWNGNDSHGSALASGVYLYRLESGGKVITRKCLLIK